MIRARHDEPATESEPSTEGLHQEVQRRADLRQLLGDLQRLPVDQRSALVLSEIRGLSHRDVAETLGCDARKVKALVFQARTHLTQLRTAHDTPCAEVQREIAARRRGAPSGKVRRHVAVCSDCALFRDELREQRSALGLLLPVVPAAGLKAKALAATGMAAGGSSGSAASGGAWLACHAQAVKLTALGASALTAAAITVPLVNGGSQPARAGSNPQVTRTHSLWRVPKATHAAAKRTIAHHARHHPRSHDSKPAATTAVAAKPHAKRHKDVVRADKRRSRSRPHRRHHSGTLQQTSPTTTVAPSPSRESDDGHEGRKHGGRHHGHAYAWGHLHARGWLRHHGRGD
jgi:hypothetical protein